MTTVQSVSPVTGYEQERSIAALVMAFGGDPMMRWVYPDPHQYLRHFPDLVRALAGRAFDHGTAYCADDFTAAALWLPPDAQWDEEAIGELFHRSVEEQRREVLFTILGQLDQHHPTEPHWYLPFIGVDPPRQGQGYGSALLAQALERCDAEHVQAFLETSNERNIPLYERHGFEVIGTVQAGGSPTLWPMLRPAQ